jgi:hypothetical protein
MQREKRLRRREEYCVSQRGPLQLILPTLKQIKIWNIQLAGARIQCSPLCRDGGHEQLISNGGMFKPAFAERDKKQTMIL